MRQLYVGDIRLDILNETLLGLGMQPLLFAPAGEVKTLTFASFYGAGPKKLTELSNGMRKGEVTSMSSGFRSGRYPAPVTWR